VTVVSPLSGQLFSLVLPYVDADGMSIFLEHMAQVFENEICVLILDGAGWHRAKDLRVPATVKLVSLPPYSPELNPVEHIWNWLRDHVFKNFAFNSLDEVMDVLCAGLKDLSLRPDLVKSLTCFEWINTLSLTYK